MSDVLTLGPPSLRVPVVLEDACGRQLEAEIGIDTKLIAVALPIGFGALVFKRSSDVDLGGRPIFRQAWELPPAPAKTVDVPPESFRTT